MEFGISLGGILAGAALTAAIPELRHAVWLALHGNLHGLRRQLRGLGGAGVALMLALMLAHAVLFYPTEIVTATAGFVYGFLPGLALATGGWLASALLAYLLGRALGRPLLHAAFGEARFERLERGVERGGTTLLVSARLIPIIPFSLMGYVAGATRVPVARFSWTTALGYLPLTAVVAYLGSRAESLTPFDPIVWIAAIGFVGLVAAGHLVARRGRLAAGA